MTADTSHAPPAIHQSVTRGRTRTLDQQQRLWGWVFLSPWIFGFVVFTAAPILFSLIFTFTDFNLGSPEEINFVGLQNWQKLFNDPLALQALTVTFKFALMAVP
ncbi:MAG: hypothetical protein MUE40_10330, partial [Anaerolineae bacterium]|nr:hypothetical protein [Anaerolineae bacterium]